MPLNLPGIKDIFRISPEDGQTLIFQGNRRIPDQLGYTGSQVFQDEFNRTVLDASKWTETAGGTGAFDYSSGTDAQLTTGTTDTSYAQLESVRTSQVNIEGIIKLVCRFKYDYNSPDSIYKLGFYFGLTDHMIFEKKDTKTSSQWIGYSTRDSSTLATGNFTVTEGVYHILTITANYTSTINSVTFDLDGTSETVSWRVPYDVLLPSLIYVKTTEAAAQTLDIDYWRVTHPQV